MSARVSTRRASAFAVALCVLAVRCNRPETGALRVTQPRFGGQDNWRPCTSVRVGDHVVESADCGAANLPNDLVSLAVDECDDAMNTAADAVRVAAYLPQCSDAAVEKLETLAKAPSGGALLSDLSAAYYVRAQRKDRPSDFVRALDAADRAVTQSSSPEARFNRALAQEALGFSDDAMESWDALRKERVSGWSDEAGQHYERLQKKRGRAAATQWALNKERLPIAVAHGDRDAVRQLIEPYCRAARIYIEDEVLPDWAAAMPAAEAVEKLALAEMIAAAFTDLTGDRYLADMVQAIRSARTPEGIRALIAGHTAFKRARVLEGALTEPAAPAFEQARGILAACRSPLHLGAMLGKATALTKARQYEDALALLRAVESAARAHHYADLEARVHSGRGYLHMTRGYDLDALAEYSTAQTQYAAAHDREFVGGSQNIIIGLLRRIGDENLTWRAAFLAQRYLADIVDPQYRHTYLGETALSAVELGYPAVAIHYQNLAVRMLEDELSHADAAVVANLRHNLGIALRTRAAIRAHMGDNRGAETDLDQSTPLLGEVSGGELSIPNAFRARLAEAEAQKLTASDRPNAIKALSEAIELAPATYYETLTASLHLQRAELYRLSGNRTEAAADLRRAIAILREEEKAALAHRPLPISVSERLWSAYFARSQDAYRRLIQNRVDDDADAEAFEYAERARGYEPLHLLLERSDLPAEFRTRIHDGEPLRLDDVKAVVPFGTVLLEYSVLGDRTYVWIVGSGRSGRRTLSVGDAAIRQWTHDLQRFAAQRDDRRFHAALAAPYKALLAEPLAVVPQSASLVIVPDRSMHGLPFAALRSGERHLIQDHAVSIEASATLYAFSLAQDRQLPRAARPAVAVVADPAFNEHLEIARDLHRLPAARNEAARIQNIYAPITTVMPPLTDTAATMPAFLSTAAQSAIVHLAAHAVANPDVPPRSFVLLAPAGNDTGVVDAERLLKDLHLKSTRLAVLSACSSAGGTPDGPEGLAPLVRPFVAAGVPGVVGTLWDVSDSRATEDLLVEFHRHYRDGRSAAEALQLAQQAMIAHRSVAHKAVWAWSAFQLYGCASSAFPAHH